MHRGTEQELDRLLARYRDAIPELEPSAEFLSQVWRRIEDSRPTSWTAIVHWAPRVAAAGALAAVLLAASAWIPDQQRRQQAVLESSYVEALTADSLDEHDEALWIMAGDRLAGKR